MKYEVFCNLEVFFISSIYSTNIHKNPDFYVYLFNVNMEIQ